MDNLVNAKLDSSFIKSSKPSIEDIYRRDLVPRLLQLAPLQKQVRSHHYLLLYLLLTFSIVGAFLFGHIAFDDSLYFFTNASPNEVFDLLTHIVMISGVLYSLISTQIVKSYRRKYKHSIIRLVFERLFENSKFDHEKSISEYDFKKSELFKTFNTFRGEDHVRGVFHELPFEMSELVVQHVTGSGKRRRTRLVFRGLFMKLKLQKDFQSTVLIKPDVAESLFGQYLGRLAQKAVLLEGYPLVELESPEFEKHFKVQSSSQLKSRVLLSPRVMDRLVSFRKKYPKESVFVSVKDSELFVGLSCSKNLFEPRIFGDLLNFKDFQEIQDIGEIIDDFIVAIDLAESDKRTA